MSSEFEFQRSVSPATGDVSPGFRFLWLSWFLVVVSGAIAADPPASGQPMDHDMAGHAEMTTSDQNMSHDMAGHADATMSDHDMSHDVDGHSGASMTDGDWTAGAPQAKHAANEPLGVARGIHPGRVSWVRDPSALDWDGVSEGTTEGYWNGHTDQAAINRMVSRSLQELTGETSDAAAWDALFRYFNRTHGNGDVGYRAGEKVNIKINLTTTSGELGRRVDADGNQLNQKEFVAPSLELTHALLDQLVNVVGVSQSDITMGDTTGVIPNYFYDYLTLAAAEGGGGGEFTDITHIARNPVPKRVVDTSSTIEMHWGSPDAEGTLQDYIPKSYADAKYFINLAILKTHARAGITLTGKNFYGSMIRRPTSEGYFNLHNPLLRETPGDGRYRPLVDLMGHEHYGGKTLLAIIDALWTGYDWSGYSPPLKWQSEPFNDSYAASILMSQDIVAIDSVGYDLWYAEADATNLPGPDPRTVGADDYLREAALADAPPSGSRYDPEGDGTILSSLGVHEHWNNNHERKYSRNLGTGDGIELVEVLIED